MRMKGRITVTVERGLILKAKRLAHQRGTSLSGLVETSLLALLVAKKEPAGSFVERWAGKFSVRENDSNEPRLAALKSKYNLPDYRRSAVPAITPKAFLALVG